MTRIDIGNGYDRLIMKEYSTNMIRLVIDMIRLVHEHDQSGIADATTNFFYLPKRVHAH